MTFNFNDNPIFCGIHLFSFDFHQTFILFGIHRMNGIRECKLQMIHERIYKPKPVAVLQRMHNIFNMQTQSDIGCVSLWLRTFVFGIGTLHAHFTTKVFCLHKIGMPLIIPFICTGLTHHSDDVNGRHYC